MSRHLRRTESARDDLLAIYEYLHSQSPTAAEAFLDEMEGLAATLRRFPKIGRAWISPHAQLVGMRVLVVPRFSSYLVFFREEEGAVTIHRVLHGARDLLQLVAALDLDDD